MLGYEIPWNQFRFAKQAYVVLEERHVESKVRALECYASQAHRNYANAEYVRNLARTHGIEIGAALRGVLRGRAVGGLRPLRVLLTATGAPGAAALIRALRANGERELQVVGTDMSEHSRRPLPVR